MTKIVLLLVSALLASSASGAVLKSVPRRRQYKSDCFKRKPVAGLLQYIPGAGIDGIKKFEPFDTVLKDGFAEVECITDYMYNHGDKFGDNKASYKLEEVSHVSIVHYDAHVKKEDRQPMSQARCFEFCRTVPNMAFFGLTNGRNCYCAPYYKKMAGDSSQCDAICPGDNTQMCGGKSKSSIFSLHNCDSTEGDLADAGKQADRLVKTMDKNIAKAIKLSKNMQKQAAALQKKFSAVGDSGAADLMQKAKQAAGKLVHAAEDVDAISKDLKGHSTDAEKIKDFKDAKEVTKAERIMETIAATVAKGADANAALEKLIGLASPSAKKPDLTDLMMAEVCAEKEGDTCKCDGDVYFAKKFSDGKPGKGDIAPLERMVAKGLYNAKSAFDGVRVVRDMKAVTGEMTCSSDELGPDPSPGFSKHCFCVTRTNPEGSAGQYLNLMHFVDSKYEVSPSTCSGDSVKDPIIGESVDGCAASCSKNHQKCVGFQFFADERLCFLFSNFDTATYYTGCKSFLQKPALLQVSGARICAEKEGDTCSCDGDVYFGKKFEDGKPGSVNITSLAHIRREGSYNKKTIFGSVKCSTDKLAPDPAPGFSKHCYCEKKAKVACYAKAARFEGTTLKPDASGKCKECLKKATKAERCWK